ncbi:oxidoreductase [Xylariaceae sp. FL0255]|nr:oxidoreductase [Xylariaceae sp. FL0255]
MRTRHKVARVEQWVLAEKSHRPRDARASQQDYGVFKKSVPPHLAPNLETRHRISTGVLETYPSSSHFSYHCCFLAMAPTRVGIVGLKPKPPGVPDSMLSQLPGYWAAGAHLPALKAMPQDYEVVAVCNSNIESATKAIETYGLGKSAKAYADPNDLANDENVDLVVISVNVGKHFMLAKPAILRKKDVFIEWPLGATLAEAEELTKMAEDAGVRTSVGVQTRADPLVVKTKEIIESGKIGKVVNSSVLISSSMLPGAMWVEGGEYYLDWKSGGNEFSIWLGHFLDSFIHVLGDFTDVNAIMKMGATEVAIINTKGEVIDPGYPKTAPENILIQGILESGAVASISQRKSKNEIDDISFRWIISGTEGELEVLVPKNFWQFGVTTRSLKVKIGSNEAEAVDFIGKEDKFESKVPMLAANPARQYDAFARGDNSRVADFKSALKTHVLLDRIVKAAGWESV